MSGERQKREVSRLNFLGLSAGIGEELIFRGALQPRFGIVLTSLFFASLHIQYGITLVMVEMACAGFLLGHLRNVTNTTCAILVHALYDMTLFFIY